MEGSTGHEPNSRAAGTVLVVDDDRDIRETVSEVLQLDGRPVAQAANGQEALQYLRSHAHPSLIVLDLSMPVMDGWRVLDELAADSSLATIPVIVVSGHFQGQASVAGRAARFLQKPVEPADLLTLVSLYCS